MAGALSLPTLRAQAEAIMAASALKGAALYQYGVDQLTSLVTEPCVLIIDIRNKGRVLVGIVTFRQDVPLKGDLAFLVADMGLKPTDVALVATTGHDSVILL